MNDHTDSPHSTPSAFNLSAIAVREGAVTLFLIIAVAFAGTFAFLKLGRAEDPVFTVKVMTVTAVWPGATAQEMQDLVAEPLEKRLQELRWYDRVETFTRQGLVFMTVNLLDSTPPSAVQEQFYQARKKLGDEASKLPKGAMGPFLNDEYSDVSFALYAVKAHGMPPRELVRHAETLRQRLLHVPGVKKVDILGERPEKIFVEFTYAKLATLGVSARDIFDALNQQNAVTPAGSVETKGPQVFVRLDGAFTDLQKLRDTPIVATGTAAPGSSAAPGGQAQGQGQILKLSDVAEVRRGYEDPPTFLISHNGEPSLVLSVVMRDGWNGLDLGKALHAEEKKVANELPLGIMFEKITDQAENITESVDEFMLKFFVALAVVLVVSLVSLGWRVGVVVAAAVPLTLAAVFVVMLATDRVFDRITLGALILSLGLLVDDAIIAIEMMVVKMEEGMQRVEAAAFAWTVTAAPMLAGTLLTVIGLMPVGFAKSGAGEYAGNIFWIVCFSLIASWLVAVIFTPYMGVKLLPDIKPVEGGHAALYATPNYQRLRRLVEWCVLHKYKVAGATAAIFGASVLGMGAVKQQFFPNSERAEVLVEIRMPIGTSIETTQATTAKIEKWLRDQPDALIVTSYVGRGAPRFFLSLNPELPDPSFAKIVILTPSSHERELLKVRLRERIAQGLAPEARVRVTQLVFGPFVPFPVMFRVMGPDADLTKLREIADQVETVMRKNPNMRDVNHDSGERTPTAHFVLDQDRLKLIGLSPQDAAQQMQFLLNGVAVTQVREDIRTVDVMARAAGWNRLDPSRLSDLTLTAKDGRPIPLDQIGRMEIRMEAPLLTRRDRTPTITVRGDIDERMQPPEVTAQVQASLKPIIDALPAGYRIETGGIVEESAKANVALAAVFPIMILLMLVVIMLQVRSFAGMMMVFLTAPLGLAGTVPILLLFNVPFGFNAIVGLIGLAGILMRNTLILVGQIDDNEKHHGMDAYHAVVEATVQRARPVLLTAIAAVLAFIPLTLSSFWGPLAYTLIGGTAAGTVLTLLFLPALFAIWFGVKPAAPAAAAGTSPAPAAGAGAGAEDRPETSKPAEAPSVKHDEA